MVIPFLGFPVATPQPDATGGGGGGRIGFFVKSPYEKSIERLWQNCYYNATTATRSVAMRQKPMKTEEGFPIRYDLVDEKVKLPAQARLAIERVEDLIAGRQPRPVEVNAASAKSGSASKFPYTDAQMDAALSWLEANVDRSNPDSMIALEIFREGARVIKDRRRGAQKRSEAVTRRLEALLQAFRELSPKFQQHPTGKKTIERLRDAVIKKRGLRALKEDTILKDIQQIPLLLRLVKEKIIPPPGQPRSTPELEERTRLEQEGGRRTAARLAANPDLLRALSDPATIFEK